ncbi:unnamed protein product [Symbiodinium pilosum]|uniref:HIT-type domain-containing protein n=1 Tax=Symbiodinium pilosum TaxID=2952 RepID=A0A812R5V2_SYMPI|nr:unnamed protein product [Symbiodinium pilosum]
MCSGAFMVVSKQSPQKGKVEVRRSARLRQVPSRPVQKAARKERNRLALLETDFATGEEADPWDPEGSDVELFSSSFARGAGKRRSGGKADRRSSKTEVPMRQRILRRPNARYDFQDLVHRVLAEEPAVNFFSCEVGAPVLPKQPLCACCLRLGRYVIVQLEILYKCPRCKSSFCSVRCQRTHKEALCR